jgi:hypothetical protein
MENNICEICKKKKKDVRFEGSEEKYICDKCLYELKRKRYENGDR